MNADEIGLLVMKLQDDDVRPSDLRRFLQVLITDEEVRKNVKIVSTLSGLPTQTRVEHCLAGVMTLLSDSTLGPKKAYDETRHRTTSLFSKKLLMCSTGPWREHIKSDEKLSPVDLQRRMRGGRGVSPPPSLQISFELAQHIRVLEEFWNVRGSFLA